MGVGILTMARIFRPLDDKLFSLMIVTLQYKKCIYNIFRLFLLSKNSKETTDFNHNRKKHTMEYWF